jgi:hypothetical protein
MFTQNSPKLAKIFHCECCDYKCSKESDYKKHLATAKHMNTYNDLQNTSEKSSKVYLCNICNKEYIFRQSLYNHKKKCISNTEKEQIPEDDMTNIKTLTNLIIELVKSNTDLQKQNHEFQEKMLELCKNSNTTINNNTNTKTKNSHNKTFNMQIFLNEHCKDAMNIKDFADSFKLEISDFEKVGHLGYVDGISDIIIKKLNEMDIHKRPIHCSDTKRDTMYVHADDVWIKDNSDHDEVRALVQRITAKNIRMIPIWQDMYPNSRNNMHKLNDTYMSLTRQAMGGFGGTIPENESKIIRKIAKSVFIDKNM